MRYLLLLVFSIHLFALDATLKIVKDVDQRAKIAVMDTSDADDPLGLKSFEIFQADLKITGHFLPVGHYRIGRFDGTLLNPSLRGIKYILKYRFLESQGNTTLKIRVLKGSDSSVVFQGKYTVNSIKRYPFLIHKAITDLNAYLGFSSVKWINRYVLFARYTGRRQSEVVVADYTFHYVKPIIKGGLNIFPIWGDPKQQTIYYTDYSGKLPTLYRLDLATAKRTKIINSEGMLVCSDVSKNGKRLLLTMAPKEQPDIYEYNIDSGYLRKLTKFIGIDVGGKYADNEHTLVFVSNRLGYANIFKKPLNAGSVSPLVLQGKNNDSCDAFGSKVVYASREEDTINNGVAFNLYLTRTDGSYTRPLTSGGVNQFPRFSNDGNTILYIKRVGDKNLVGYIGLNTNQSMLFPLGDRKIQSIDW